jgi:N-acetylglutamate synthase-like GNAT family acetyltransferase
MLAQFYQRLGFVPVAISDLPPALHRKFRVSNEIARLLRLPLHHMR